MTARFLLLPALACLAACGGGEPFAETRPVSVAAGPYLLDVYRAGDRVRVLRTERDLRSESDFARVAIPVAERIMGCTIDRATLTGGPMSLQADLVAC